MTFKEKLSVAIGVLLVLAALVGWGAGKPDLMVLTLVLVGLAMSFPKRTKAMVKTLKEWRSVK